MEHPLIIIDPEINNGQATIKGTPFTVQFILEQLASGMNHRDLYQDYPPLTWESFKAAMLFHSDQLKKEKGYPCPCCGYLVHAEPPGSHDICSICFWEDDADQPAFPLHGGGANRVTLLTGQKNYLDFGACEERLKPHVRLPLADEQRAEDWRPLDLTLDSYSQKPHD